MRERSPGQVRLGVLGWVGETEDFFNSLLVTGGPV
jgi:hypothetical protein